MHKLHKICLMLPAFFAVCFLFACTISEDGAAPSSEPVKLQSEEPTVITSGPTLPPEPPDLTAARALLAKLSDTEKIAQLFIVRPEDLNLTPEEPPQAVTEFTPRMEEALRRYPVGGVCIFHQNLTDPGQIQALNRALGQSGPIPPFLSVDEEGGSVARLANHPGFDLPRYRSAGAVGASEDPSDAYAMGHTIGSYLKEFGFNMDFAPVADVNTNPSNPVIGNRAFSSDPVLAATLARAAADGLQDAGIIPVFKHFPGHGDTAEDSHQGLAVSHQPLAHQRQTEWLPFRQAGEADCIMVGHIALPELGEPLVPASLSKPVVTDILREELGFGGLIVTDSLSMGAITQTYSSAEAAIRAFEAGCHLILMPEDFPAAVLGMEEALDSGRISMEQLNQRVLEILLFKFHAGLMEPTA